MKDKKKNFNARILKMKIRKTGQMVLKKIYILLHDKIIPIYPNTQKKDTLNYLDILSLIL